MSDFGFMDAIERRYEELCDARREHQNAVDYGGMKLHKMVSDLVAGSEYADRLIITASERQRKRPVVIVHITGMTKKHCQDVSVTPARRGGLWTIRSAFCQPHHYFADIRSRGKYAPYTLRYGVKKFGESSVLKLVAYAIAKDVIEG